MSAPRPQDKVLTADELVARFSRPREGRLVFTNGCFDLLHRGHAAYLAEARALGDRLVVGVNTDASFRRLNKGPGRPVVSEEDRAYLLAALASVDAVCLFDEDTPRALVSRLLPDILVKGGDYRIAEVVGKDEVEAAGGRVVLIPFVQGYSTTELIRRIREET